MKALDVRGRRERQGDRGRRCPADIEPRRSAAREALIEMVAEADEALMEKFFEAGTLTQDELVEGLQARRGRRTHLPARVHVGHGEHRHAAAARRRRQLRALAGRAAVRGHGEGIGRTASR